MSDLRKPQVGDEVLFHLSADKDPVRGQISRVWTDGCVNLLLDDGSAPTSVALIQHGPTPSGYWCAFSPPAAWPFAAPAPAGPFRFPLKATPGITVSGEIGLVIARAEHLNAEPQYLLRYRRNDGIATEQWWGESALS